MAITRATAWERYREDLVRRNHSPKTISTYRGALYGFWASLSERSWDAARAADLDRFLRRPRSGRPLAPKSAETYTAAITRFYRWAVAEGYLRRDPMAKFARPRPSRHAIPRAIPWEGTPAGAGMATLLSYAETDPRLKIMVLLCYRGGLRISEVAGLRAEDVSLGPLPTMRVVGKGNRERVVPLHPWLRDELAAWLAARPSRGPVIEHAVYPGRPITGKYVGDMIGQAMRALGVVNDAGAPATPHGLRHSFASEMARVGRGRNERAIGMALGHAPGSAITRLYTLGFDEDLTHDIGDLPGPRTAAPGATDA